ncbi:hypothetical protein VPHG_00095 [Vibrio phage 11895-B1]|uniref:hypothetical protein n=1 Tax=Vibrio phage 11895-B1 TaxID=754075 RepID=UPI0002C130EB|nr:hypothetical protein VPHG_00095 [Vibrio phage 11895-B1]AGH32162.1 hypothetical protein VPHG_00095 [Vibrio phage 11895-B1]
MTITQVDHISEGLSRPTSVLQQEEVTKFLTIFLNRYQMLEESFLILANQKSIDLAVGVWLDYIGKILNVNRSGASDDDYREELRLRIALRSSDGTPPVVIQLLRDFTDSTEVIYNEYGNAYVTFNLNGKTNIGNQLWEMLQSIKPVGVKCILQNDYNDNAFYPAYEISAVTGEVFQTTSEGSVYENFMTTSDGINYETFFTQSELDQFYIPSLKGEQNTFYYETGRQFQFTSDGINYEDATLTTENGEENFLVIDPYNEGYVPDNIRPFVWEVQQDSVTRID